ncbi:MAG: GMC oxidoreductase, partial [Algoriphagus sp.]
LVDGFEDQYYKGRRPNGIYIPRYVNLKDGPQSDKFVRGFGFQGGGQRAGWGQGTNMKEFGGEFKDKIMNPGPWEFFITGFAESLPNHENRVFLNKDVLDKWGQPTLSIDAEWGPNELAINAQMRVDAAEMLERAGLKDIVDFDNKHEMGYGIHEMGTARMGRDPKTSVLNSMNQIHACKNVFVTDGAAMTSSSCVNPSLTYMALTARAAAHAVSELKKLNL